jgi:hypothetical protein
MERETGIEPATFSLGKWLQIENKEHREFGHLFQAIEFTGNSRVFATRFLTVFKWSSLDAGQSFATHKTPQWLEVDGDPAISHYSRIHSGDIGVFRE